MSSAFDDDPEFGGAIRKPEAGPGMGVRILRILKTIGCLTVVVLVLRSFLAAYDGARDEARRAVCTNHLKFIGQAMHDYEVDHGALPPVCTVDATGRRLHSWRVLLLPYLSEEALYRAIDLSKPWDDPANAEAAAKMPSVYGCFKSHAPRNTTTYLANAAEGGLLMPGKPRRLAEVEDGKANTLMVIEVDDPHAVPWMAPIDADESLILGLLPDSKLAHTGGMNAAFVDGSVRFLKATTPVEVRRALISIAGHDASEEDAY